MRPLIPLIALLSASAFAQEAGGRLTVEEAWVRLAPPGTRTTAAYMVIRNTGGQALRILRVESPAARAAELHDHLNVDGIMRMRPVPAIAIEGGGEKRLQPGGLHIMLLDLKAPLRAGAGVPIILWLEDGSRKIVEARVR